MKCKQLIKEYGHISRNELPPEIRKQIDADPQAQAWFNQHEMQRELLSLKRHEQPAPEVHGRVVYHVRTRIEAGERMAVPEIAPPRSALYLQLTAVAAIAFVGTVTYINTQRAPSQPGLAIQEAPVAAPVVATEETDGVKPIDALFKPIPTSTNSTDIAATNGVVIPSLNGVHRSQILPVRSGPQNR